MNYTFRLTTLAEQDLIDAEEYIASYADLDFVDEIDERFFAAFGELCKNPLQHPIYQFKPSIETLHEYRSVNVYHYKVFYWIDDDVVEIYRIRHLVSDFTRKGF